jgi:uncharacterized protein (DUF488 family)
MTFVYTIGHSTHSFEALLNLLQQHGVTAVADVRSQPYSGHVPHFSRQPLEASLTAARIAYVFLGRELGARPNNPAAYRNGRVDFGLLAQQPEFMAGLDRVIEGMAKYRIALLCSEKDPLFCHRAILVARELTKRGVRVCHILSDGSSITHGELEQKMRSLHGLSGASLWDSDDERLRRAYDLQGEATAYRQSESSVTEDELE